MIDCLVPCGEKHSPFSSDSLLLPMTALFPETADPLALHLIADHQKRYERIKAWRESQSDPYFSEVTPQWRRFFEKRQIVDANTSKKGAAGR